MNHKFLLSGIIIVLVTACGQSELPTNAVKPPIQQELGEVLTQDPQPQLAQVTEDTRQTYQWYCSQCHGVKGKGDGINAKFLTVPPRNHTKAAYLETRTDEQLFEAIKFGGLSVGRAPCMPAWGHTLEEDVIHSLVRYIRELCHCEVL
ncbi:MAG: cytochrome c [Nitrospinae bacterium]|nr:cytochrome c [Nitrospinota bacterium]